MRSYRERNGSVKWSWKNIDLVLVPEMGRDNIEETNTVSNANHKRKWRYNMIRLEIGESEKEKNLICLENLAFIVKKDESKAKNKRKWK